MSSYLSDLAPSNPSRIISIDDFFAARHCFLRFVPFELANAILDAAMYWPSVTADRTKLLVVSADFVNKKTLPHAILLFITPPIPQVVRSSVVLPMRIRMVEFTLQSCDQGYGGSPKIRGNLATTTMRREPLFSVDKQAHISSHPHG